MSRSTQRIRGTLLLGDDHSSIGRAAQIIQNGGIVAFPTETVYGLGASAVDACALEKIFAAKGRPSDNPLIVHIASLEQLQAVATDIPASAIKLAEIFWPGPLSLVLPRSDSISALVSAGLSTVAVRMPDHPVALNLICQTGSPIAAPSANISGKPSPTTFRHVLEDLTGRIDAVIRSDTCPIGLESTVLDLSGLRPIMLRPGGISREALESALGQRVLLAGQKAIADTPLSPGMKYRHYSPRAPLLLIAGPASRREHLITAIIESYRSKGFDVGLLSSALGSNLNGRADSEHLAANLYDSLRRMDRMGVDLILAEETEIKGLGLAIMNRLRKAATRVLKA